MYNICIYIYRGFGGLLSVVYWARFRIWGAVAVAWPVVGKRKASCNNRGSDERSQSKASY